MKRFLFLLMLLLTSGYAVKAQIFNKNHILGDWVIRSYTTEKSGKTVRYPPRIEGLSFFENHTYRIKDGFFKRSGNLKIYLGSSSQFKLTGQNLSLFNLSDKKWYNFQVINLEGSSMQLVYNGIKFTYRRIEPYRQQPLFETIVLTSSGCFGECPAFSISIDISGRVIFRGVYNTSKIGLYTGTISRKVYKELELNFSKLRIDTMGKLPHHIDAMAMSTTFIKDGKVFKTIYNSDHDQSRELRWAYIPLENLYQQIKLKEEKVPNHLKNLDLRFHAGDKVIDMKPSDEFLLFTYLLKGKPVNHRFKTKFSFRSENEYSKKEEVLYTDGRYYKFMVNNKPLILDIGFNFYDVNCTGLKWISDRYF
ncbi:DUF6438 domain-containing protein [Mucilaginibacter auburnensis]|uniref:DUF6438 domain-containing protein n=1 Tax=Mucilaginibacter auburnensis TaxID=1457233 RepID=A0A2H9VM20_9SPHI|nr:DUF6438 domain-containing protein [Mucilaginibacter auburnensis]PJJ79387.1 hypothetical protein CLV57_2521 [Mucilaginibacter auburnensis]